jgi:hypothetical protein
MSFPSPDPTQLESWEVVLLRMAHAVSLSKPQYELICKRYETLQAILDAATDPVLKDAHIFVQGSIRLQTTTKPPPGATGEIATVDADAVVWLPHAQGASAIEILQAIERRFRAGVRVETPIELLRRGIRIVYADEKPGFHIDVTPARSASGNGQTHGAGNLEVPDRQLGWKPSSPIPYSDWLAFVAEQHVVLAGTEELLQRQMVLREATQDPIPEYEDYVDANPLRAIIKLLKRHRDLWTIRTHSEKARPISAVITTLATQAYLAVLAEHASGRRSYRPIEAMIEIVDRMSSFAQRGTSGWQVLNPKNAGENFAEKWNRPGAEGTAHRQAFVTWHEEACSAMRLGLRDLGSTIAFEDSLIKQFGAERTLLREAMVQLPANWTLPGRAAGLTANRARLAGLAGGAAAGRESQAETRPVDRLG